MTWATDTTLGCLSRLRRARALAHIIARRSSMNWRARKRSLVLVRQMPIQCHGGFEGAGQLFAEHVPGAGFELGTDGRRHLDGMEFVAAVDRHAHNGIRLGEGEAPRPGSRSSGTTPGAMRSGRTTSLIPRPSFDLASRSTRRRPTTRRARRGCLTRIAPGSRLASSTRPSKTGILDFGYAHEFIKDAKVTRRCSTGRPRAPQRCLTGTFKNQADIFSIQYSQSF